jgi:hypothetical protein
MPLGIDTKTAVKYTKAERARVKKARALMIRAMNRGAALLGLPRPDWGETNIPMGVGKMPSSAQAVHAATQPTATKK